MSSATNNFSWVVYSIIFLKYEVVCNILFILNVKLVFILNFKYQFLILNTNANSGPLTNVYIQLGSCSKVRA